MGLLGPSSAGFGLGAAAGQLGDLMSAPRRAAWSMMGLPENGNELVAKAAGGLGYDMDPEGALAHALGMGAEMLGDPLSRIGALGALGGSKLRGMFNARKAMQAEEMARLAGNVESLQGLGSKFGAAADASKEGSALARAVELENAREHAGLTKNASEFLGMPLEQAQARLHPDAMRQIPDIDEMRKIAEFEAANKGARTSGIRMDVQRPSGDVAERMAALGIGQPNPEGSLAVMPRWSDAAKRPIAPPILNTRGGAANLSALAPMPNEPAWMSRVAGRAAAEPASPFVPSATREDLLRAAAQKSNTDLAEAMSALEQKQMAQQAEAERLRNFGLAGAAGAGAFGGGLYFNQRARQ